MTDRIIQHIITVTVLAVAFGQAIVGVIFVVAGLGLPQ